MAGYTSTARKYGEYIQPYNIDLIAKGLSFKQGQYDAADAKIRSKITEIEGMDLMKAEDKQHLLNNLKGMLGDINAVGALDLSNNDVTRALESHISQSIDDKVMNAYASTKEIRNFQQKMQEMEAKGVKEGGYHPDNMAYAMRFVSDYLNDGKVGSKLSDYGSLVYRPFVDVNKKVDEILDQLKGRGDGMIETVGPDGVTMIKKDMNSMTPEEVMNLVNAHLTPDMQEQLKITTWAKMGGGKTPESQAFYQQQLGNYQNTLTKRLNDQKVSLTSALAAKDITNEQRTLIQNNLSNIETELSSLPQRMQMLAQNFEQGAMAMGVDEYLSRATAQIYPIVKGKGVYSTGEYSKIHEKNTQWAFDERNAQREDKKLELAIDEHRMKVEKHEYEKANGLWGKSGSSSSSSSSGGKDGNGGGNGGGSEPVVTDGLTEYADENFDARKEFDDTFKGAEEDYATKMNIAFDYFMGGKFASSEDRAAGQALKDAYIKAGGDVKKYDPLIWQRVWVEMGDKYGITNIYDANGDVATTYSDIEYQRDNLSILSSMQRDVNNNSRRFNKIASNFFRDENLKRFVNPANQHGLIINGKRVSLGDFLIKRGFVDKDGNKLQNLDRQTLTYIRKHADKSLRGVFSYLETYHSDAGVTSDDEKVEQGLYRNVLKNLNNNKEITFTNLSDKEKTFVLTMMSGNQPLSTVVNPDNITAVRYIINSSSGGIKAVVSVKKPSNRDGGAASSQTYIVDTVNKNELYKNVPWFEQNMKMDKQSLAFSQTNILKSGGITSSKIKFFSPKSSAERETQVTNAIENLGLDPQEQAIAISGLTKDGTINAIAPMFSYEHGSALYTDILADRGKTPDQQKQAIFERQQSLLGDLNNVVNKVENGHYKIKVTSLMGGNGAVSIVDNKGNTISKLIYPGFSDFEKITKLLRTSTSSALALYLRDVVTRESVQKGTGPLSETFKSAFNL